MALKPKAIKKIIKLKSEGKKQKEISSIMGISEQTISKRLRAINIIPVNTEVSKLKHRNTEYENQIDELKAEIETQKQEYELLKQYAQEHYSYKLFKKIISFENWKKKRDDKQLTLFY